MDERDEEILTILDQYRKRGVSPTHAEIADWCDVSEKTVRKRLRRLRDDGEVTWEPGTKRTLRRADMKGKSIPMS